MNLRHKNILSIVLTVVFFLAASAAAIGWSLQSTRGYELVGHTHVVIERINNLKADVLTCESGLRGYIESGNRKFLHERDRAAVRLPITLKSLAADVADNPQQLTKLELLDNLVEDKLVWQQQVISDYESGGRSKADEDQETDKGAIIREQLFKQAGVMEAVEKQLLLKREQSYYFTKLLLSVVVVVLSMFGIVFLIKTILSALTASRLDQQRKVALEQLEYVNSDLNQQVSDLIKSREDLRNAVNARSQFLANISHELRTPLAGIIGSTELVLSMPLLEEQRALITTAKNCGDALWVLVNDLLDFARIESPNFRLHLSNFDLVNSVKAALEPLEQKAKSKGLQFGLHVAEDIPTCVEGDFTRIRQVLINLVDNAIKYTDTGSITVALTVRSQTVSFTVADTGIGIAPDQLDIIFDRFVQVDGSTTRQQGGAGLGLAISKSLAELMNGTIEVTSNPGIGSQFTLTIPFVKPAQSTALPVQEKICIHAQQGKETILLVDDSEVIRTVVTAQLKKLGFNVETVTNGEEAIGAARNKPYGLIIMDAQMPVMDGYTATQTIRTQQDNPCSKIPIIALTANAMPEDRERCLQAGMSDYMAKPVGLEKLQAMLNKWIARPETEEDSIARVTALNVSGQAKGRDTASMQVKLKSS